LETEAMTEYAASVSGDSPTSLMTSSMKVLVREPIAPAGIELLRERFDVHVDSESDLEERIGLYDALIVRSGTKVTAELIDRAERLKVIGRAGVGVDNVDVAAATRRGIVVANAPQSTVISAAEHTMALLLALARNVPQAHAALREGRWERSRFGGIELAGKTLGIVGFGRIGRELADLARAVGMHVLAHDPLVDDATTPLDALFENADVVSLHAPLTDETRGLIGPQLLARAKPGLVLVNTARGALVSSHDDLLSALESGRLGGVGLDVFEEEPPDPTHPLFAHPRVVVTPHALGLTIGANEAVFRAMAEGVAAVLRGERPPHVA
jgi:D-3-phosphoglycerate dehydrogenase / 2-oxoglutarate reductase